LRLAPFFVLKENFHLQTAPLPVHRRDISHYLVVEQQEPGPDNCCNQAWVLKKGLLGAEVGGV
jgi:hypothetical protein